ncbi:MAG TPA: protein translocase subunit SecD [Bryobacterales bacterium]|nr:protein translocase subunit SecD [Bryobacterales bacterium]
MSRSLLYKTILIVVVVLGCIYGVIEVPRSRAELLANLQRRIHLGLDLKGGSHLVLQVQVQDAVRASADSAVEQLKTDLNRRNIPYTTIDRNDPQTIEQADSIALRVQGVPAERSSDFKGLISDRLQDWIFAPVDSTTWKLTMKPSALHQLELDTVQQSLRTIENRINGLGLTEPTIQPYGGSDDFRILVQLPGVDDPARVKEMMQTTALLEYKAVKGGPFPSTDAALPNYGGVLPENTEILKSAERGSNAAESWYVVDRVPVITGRDLRNARPAQDPNTRGWDTEFSLSVDAGQKFGRYTEANVGNRLGIVLDHRVVSAPVIKGRIEDHGEIEGMRNQQEASDLALVLNAGSLPAGIQVLEERTVGPSLGADSIREGIISGLAGLVAVVIFMLVYYKMAGVNAVTALLLNVVILLAALAYFGATLTLPGIAGVILTVGMAVDSNVLIFERIREELRGGKTVVAAVDAGFSKAFLTIIDTHVTTIVSSAFLFLFGTATVRGFAVTLSIGLVANVFTAVFVSRVIFDYHLSQQHQVKELSI